MTTVKQGKEDFEIVKEKNDKKGNYIFQKDNITLVGFYIIAIVLIILINCYHILWLGSHKLRNPYTLKQKA